MTDAQHAALKRKLNRLAKLAQEVADDARAVVGDDASLYFESSGHFYILQGDGAREESGPRRQGRIRAESSRSCDMAAGAW